jgi:hypothetical protein
VPTICLSALSCLPQLATNNANITRTAENLMARNDA